MKKEVKQLREYHLNHTTKKGEPVFPVTTTDAVFDKNGNKLSKVISNIEKKIGEQSILWLYIPDITVMPTTLDIDYSTLASSIINQKIPTICIYDELKNTLVFTLKKASIEESTFVFESRDYNNDSCTAGSVHGNKDTYQIIVRNSQPAIIKRKFSNPYIWKLQPDKSFSELFSNYKMSGAIMDPPAIVLSPLNGDSNYPSSLHLAESHIIEHLDGKNETVWYYFNHMDGEDYQGHYVLSSLGFYGRQYFEENLIRDVIV